MKLGLILACLAGSALAEPQRIVSAGGDLTEIVIALGARDQLVGIDTTSTHPPALKDAVANVGYVRGLSAEGVLALQPDLVLGAYDVGPQTALDQLASAGVAVAVAPGGQGAGSVPAKMRFVGEAIGKPAEAEKLVASYETAMADIAAALATVSDSPKVLFILSISDGAPMVGGAGSSADAIIRLAGATNAAQGFEGFKQMNKEAIMAAAPDVILMMDGHADRSGGIDEVMARPEIALTPAGQAKRSLTMDGMLLLGFGPRTPQAVRELARALYPEDAGRLGF